MRDAILIVVPDAPEGPAIVVTPFQMSQTIPFNLLGTKLQELVAETEPPRKRTVVPPTAD